MYGPGSSLAADVFARLAQSGIFFDFILSLILIS